jgi:hypothetical protein
MPKLDAQSTEHFDSEPLSLDAPAIDYRDEATRARLPAMLDHVLTGLLAELQPDYRALVDAAECVRGIKDKSTAWQRTVAVNNYKEARARYLAKRQRLFKRWHLAILALLERLEAHGISEELARAIDNKKPIATLRWMLEGNLIDYPRLPSKTFILRYKPQECPLCATPVKVGQEAIYNGDKITHKRCLGAALIRHAVKQKQEGAR